MNVSSLAPGNETIGNIGFNKGAIDVKQGGNSCILSSICNLFNITSSCFHVAASKERTAVLKLFNRSHKSKKTKQNKTKNKKTRRNSAAPPSRRELFTQRISGFSDRGFSVAISMKFV